MTYKLKVRKPEIIRGPTNVDYEYELKLYDSSEVNIKDIDSLNSLTKPPSVENITIRN